MNLTSIVKDFTILKAGQLGFRAMRMHPLIALAIGGGYLGYKVWKAVGSEAQLSESKLIPTTRGTFITPEVADA